ncbi:phage tail sheath subtilisin-like domain-containing protein [Pseudaestuariivita sp.]|uniref:phage tail sheath subtilisin-like domain-containing protein n=1 Tax=Pseudaestuariivita sp. TaxID=2211669 RepID=UPI004059F900
MPEQFLHGVEVVQVDDGIRPIATAKSSVIGLVGTAPDADGDIFPLDTPVLVEGPRKAALFGDGGTLKDAYSAVYSQGAVVAVVVRVAEGADANATLANVVGDATAGTGVWALEAARSALDLTPRILAAPGFTSMPAADPASPVTTNLVSVAEKLRAIVVADGPNTNETEAKLARQKWGSDRLLFVDPAVQVFDTETAAYVTRPASGYVAGLIAKRDLERGFWWSPSNQVINGITGTARPIGFNLSSTETEANRLNEDEVTTIIRRNGFRLWGNRGTGADQNWAFISVRRTADIIYESIEAAHLWAMDRPMSAQLIEDIRDGVQGFGQSLVNQGALLGFNCWLDPELNTEVNLKAGKLFLNFDFEPPAPLEHLIFRAHRNGDYYEDLVSQVRQAA